MDAPAITDLLSSLDRELWVVTAASDWRRGGLIATFVSPASIVPEMPRVCVGLAKQHHTWQLVEASNAFGLHLLGERHLEWVWAFGTRSGRDVDKLAGAATFTATTGTPLLSDALAWLDCRVETKMNTGDRTAYIASVVAGARYGTTAPLTVRRMLQLASPERRRDLEEGLRRDAAADAAAIEAWRQSMK